MILNLIKRNSLFALSAFISIMMLSIAGHAEDTLSELKKDPLLSAMQDELMRAQRDLRLPGQPAPYFIEYWVQESVSATLSGKYGSITHSHPDLHPQRLAGVQIRIGDRELDNTNLPLKVRFGPTDYAEYMEENDWRLMQVPIEGSGASLRAALWLMSDMSYKRALGDYQKKKMLVATGVQQDKIDDFSHEKPEVVIEPIKEVGIAVNDDAWRTAVRQVTGYLAAKPDIMEPGMEVKASRDINYYLNTEGSVIRTSEVIYDVDISAWTRTTDGMKINDYRHVMVRDAKELPDLKKLLAEAEALATELADLRNAEDFNPYTGPAILGPDVAGVFFHEALGHRLEGERQRMTESGQTFKGKIGEKIVSEQITVIDDPTMERFNGKTLVGHYRYDDEGVAAQKVTLIEKGVLKNYLMSRTPVKGFSKSNGHGRSQNPASNSLYGHAVGRMANLIVESTNALNAKKLKAMLIREAKKQGKQYGLIIKRVKGGDTDTQTSSVISGNYQAFRATPVLVYAVDVNTGIERLVRGVELVGTPLSSLERIVATGDDSELFNGACGAESGWVPVSVVSPSILTAQVELQRTGGTPKKAPILMSPFQEKRQLDAPRLNMN